MTNEKWKDLLFVISTMVIHINKWNFKFSWTTEAVKQMCESSFAEDERWTQEQANCSSGQSSSGPVRDQIGPR